MATLSHSSAVQTVTLNEAQKRLAELVRNLPAGREVLIVEADRPVARLVGVERTSLHDLKPSSIGAPLRPFPAPDDDLLGEMLDPRQ